MYENIKELINNSNYDKAKNLIVEELKINDDSDLWYLLFLAENNNYLEIDPNNINNTYAYDQAIRTNNEEYELEFKLYKELALLGLNKIFRLIQLEKYDDFNTLLDTCEAKEFKLSIMANAYLTDMVLDQSKDNEMKAFYYSLLFSHIIFNNKNDTIININDKLLGYINQVKKNRFVIDGYKLKKYIGKEKNVIIPSYITEIEDYAFQGCDITNVILPNDLYSIGKCAFRGCIYLKNIIIPDSVKYIGCKAFYDCESLDGINIPNGITEILDSTFYNCSNLTNITIPSSVQKIENSAFSLCVRLVEIFNLSSLDIIVGPRSEENGDESYLGEYAIVVHNEIEESNIIIKDDFILL